jgi:hypothetical protein
MKPRLEASDCLALEGANFVVTSIFRQKLRVFRLRLRTSLCSRCVQIDIDAVQMSMFPGPHCGCLEELRENERKDNHTEDLPSDQYIYSR